MAAEVKTIEVVIAPAKTNTYAFVLFVVTLLIFGIPFALLYGVEAFVNAWKSFLSDILLLSGATIGGMVFHEFLHAFPWALNTPDGWKDVSFGMNWKQIAPFVHCRAPLRINHYFIGVIAPGVILGLLPMSFALFLGNGFLLCFGTFFTAGAAGDFIAARKLLDFGKQDFVFDHPDHLGFTIHKHPYPA